MKRIYYMLGITLALLMGLSSCSDEGYLNSIEKVNLLRFEFPQGTDSWDKEIEQIAKDWNMYIIYKNVDTTDLNRAWTIPDYRGPIYVCDEPSGENVQLYLDFVRKWLLAGLDKNNPQDLKELPAYLFIVNNFRNRKLDGVESGGRDVVDNHIYLFKGGLDYWTLSFKDKELESGELSGDVEHTVACSFAYPGIKTRVAGGEYGIPDAFKVISDYDTPIGFEYVSFEAWKKQYPSYPDMFYTMFCNPDQTDSVNCYQSRGFVPNAGEDFKVNFSSKNAAPTWMPWITYDFYGVPWNNNPNAASVPDRDGRVVQDYLAFIRFAMIYTEARIREMFPEDIDDENRARGNQMVNRKYDIVVKAMKELGVDLQSYAAILGTE